MLFFSCAGREKIRSNLESHKINNWVCIYNDNAPVSTIRKFDLAILDADAHPDLTELKKSNTILIGYVSLGEVGEYRWYWNLIADKPWILDKNPNWNSRMIDVRTLEWHEWLIDKIIPKILEQGFDGIFLDTIDNAEYLEKYHPKIKYPGAQAGMITLIKAIRKRFPSIYIIANRGFSIIHEIGPLIDGVVAESIFTTIDVNNNKVRLLTPDEYSSNIKQLLAAKKSFDLTVFTLDYADPENTSFIRSIITRSREYDFIPYISTTKLDRIYLNTLEL
ncbi:MAG: endo alpha-1,4 polygalactosaminidase [bacterium]